MEQSRSAFGDLANSSHVESQTTQQLGDTRATSWHVARHRAILAALPEVRELMGPSRVTAVLVIAVCGAQTALAVMLRHAGYLPITVVAFVVGAVLVHALGVLIHEC